MEFKRRRMMKSEIDRLLGDEGTRNLLSGIKALHKNKKLTRTRTLSTTRNRKPTTINTNTSNISNGVNGTTHHKKIIKKSLSLLVQNGKKNVATNAKVSKPVSNGKIGRKSSSSSSSGSSSGGSSSSKQKKKVTSTTTQKVKSQLPQQKRKQQINGVNKSVKMRNGAGIHHSGGNNGIVKKITSTAAKIVKLQQNSTSNVNSSNAAMKTMNSLPLLATIVRDHVGFITLSYQSHLCQIRNQDLRDLVRKLEEYESRKGISVIVLNSSSDRIFCDGLDYKEIHSDLNKRKHAVQLRIHCIKNFLMTLAKSKKLLVASVNGGKVNSFGLMFLTLFDLVYASDKATFTLQKYLQLKQPPEGVSTFNQGQLSSPLMKSMIYTGRVSTASEMHENNFLVTDILWGSRYHEELASKLQNISSQEHTKSIYKTYSSKNTKQLSNDLAHEFTLLESIWMSDSWQNNFLKQQNRDNFN